MVQKELAVGSKEPESNPAVKAEAASANMQASEGLGVEAVAAQKFISGVVEGFYGRPWTMEQRKELFRRLQKWGLNTYLYAPKDDFKHRMFWREMYSVEEAEELLTLICAAKEQGIKFIYAISPGLDITFSNHREVSTLKRKLDQVSRFGCKCFALLFDDIDHNMCPADREVFSSYAHAQVSVTNEIFQYLGEPETFLFCPTEYCGMFCYPSVFQSSYLHTIGENLLPGIQVLWTGPKVVSKEITVESIEEVSKILKRSPVIWDNIHANDYDQKRLFLGPYKGRSTELIPRIRGVLINPNCEFETNFIAIHTLATWYKSNMNGVRKDVMNDSEDSTVSVQIKLKNEGSDEELETDTLYSPQLALKLALTDWLPEFWVSQQYSGLLHVAHSGGINSLAHVTSLRPSTMVTAVFQQPIMSPVLESTREPHLLVKEDKNVQAEAEKRETDKESMEMVEEKQDEVHGKDVGQITTEMVQAKMMKELKPVDLDKGSLGEVRDPEALLQEDTANNMAPMQMDEQIFRETYVPNSEEKPLFMTEGITLEDLNLLVELFYLPYEHGSQAAHMLREFHWLCTNSSTVSVNANGREPKKVAEWQDRAKRFEEMCCSIIQMFSRLSNSPNRTILSDLYPYIWDIKNIISMVKSFVQWLDGRILCTSFYCYWIDSGRWCRSQSSAQFIGGDQEAWAFRGGLAGEFQRLLPIDGANDLFFQPPPVPPTSKIYSIRPYFPKDEPAVYKICSEIYNAGLDGLSFSEQDPDLIGDRLVGGFLTLSPDYGFVLEDEEGICGYALGTVDFKLFMKKCKMSWIPSMQEKYNKPDCEKDLSEAEKMMLSFHEEEVLPDCFLSNFPSLIKVEIHTKVTDPSVAKSLMGCLLSSLKANGSHGAFCEVRQTDKRILEFYSKLGCFEVAKMDGFPKDVIIMGRSL